MGLSVIVTILLLIFLYSYIESHLCSVDLRRSARSDSPCSLSFHLLPHINVGHPRGLVSAEPLNSPRKGWGCLVQMRGSQGPAGEELLTLRRDSGWALFGQSSPNGGHGACPRRDPPLCPSNLESIFS